jgi:hypothetical protein
VTLPLPSLSPSCPLQFHLYSVEAMDQWLASSAQDYAAYLEALQSASQASHPSFAAHRRLQVWTFSPLLYRYLTEALQLPAQRVFLVPLWGLVDSGRFFYSRYHFVKSRDTGALQLPAEDCDSTQVSTVSPSPSAKTAVSSCAVKPMHCSAPPSSPCPQPEVVFFAQTFKEPFALDRFSLPLCSALPRVCPPPPPPPPSPQEGSRPQAVLLAPPRPPPELCRLLQRRELGGRLSLGSAVLCLSRGPLGLPAAPPQ